MKDNILNLEYDHVRVNAQELSNQLKENYAKLGINITDFFGKFHRPKETPKEIYEYQNFFLLKKEDGTLYLLDGFRRLLIFDVPDMEISCRIYYMKDFVDTKHLLRLLVSLNHTKFFGGMGAYYERGFALCLQSIFGVNILKVQNTVDGYLTLNQGSWSKYDTDRGGYEEVCSRIINNNFIPNIKFFNKCLEYNLLLTKEVGLLIWKKGGSYDFDIFLEKLIEKKLFVPLFERYKKNEGSRKEELKNQILQVYEDVLDVMDGKKETFDELYAEKIEKCNELVKQIAKDKSFTKLSGKTSPNAEEKEILDAWKDETKKILWKAVVYPEKENFSKYGSFRGIERDYLPYGIYENISVTDTVEKHLGFGVVYPKIELDGRVVTRGYDSYRSESSSRKYIEVINQKVVIFYKIISK